MEFSGIFAPITTPFNQAQDLALHELESNLENWLNKPMNGLVVPGSNSETVFLSQTEKLAIWEIVGQALSNSDKRFIAGTGAESTMETINLTEQAAEFGADAALIIPPHFYKRFMTHEVLVRHYWELADNSPISIFIYNVPAFTGIDIAHDTILEISEHPNVIGMKDSSVSVTKLTAILAKKPNFQIFSGTGSALLPFLTLGAVGGIMALANFASVPLHALWAAFLESGYRKASHIQLSLSEINYAVTARYGISGLKYAMDLAGLYGGPARRPLLPLREREKKEIERLLEDVHLIA